MKSRDFQLVFVILGLVLSAALMSGTVGVGSALLTLAALSGSLLAFSIWVRSRAGRFQTLLAAGLSVLLAATLWFDFILVSVDQSLRLLIAFALAWMVAFPVTFALTAIAERFSVGLRS